jgi:hypothetical protein
VTSPYVLYQVEGWFARSREPNPVRCAFLMSAAAALSVYPYVLFVFRIQQGVISK